MQSIERLVQPASEPVTIIQAKLHCRVSHADEDSFFTDIAIPAARQEAEHILGRTLLPTTWRHTLDGFPDCGEILLPYPQVTAISDFQYRDSTEAWVDVEAALYAVDMASKPGRIYLKWDKSWPITDSTYDASVRVDYVAGYANIAAVPASIKAWLLIRIAQLYEHREQILTGTILSEIPFVTGLLDPHRVFGGM